MPGAAVRERQHMVMSPQALSFVPAAMGLKLYVSAKHTGSFVVSFLVQTPVGEAYTTSVEIENPLFPMRKKGFKEGTSIVP